MVTAYVALGSNLGDRLGNLASAVDAIAHLEQTVVADVSHAYESEAAYHADQPPFLNAVAKVETGLEAEGLLVQLGEIENEMGRVREFANGPRIIDLDLLLYGDEEWNSESLTLPHPGLLERDFVVTPLLEIAPHVRLPDGTHPRRSKASIGPVVRDLGLLPDVGMEHNMPIEHTDWVTVQESEGPQTAIGGFDAGLQFARQVLDQEHIPWAFEPFEPGLDMDVLGRPRVFKLVVPAAYATRAEELLAKVETAPLEGAGDSG